MGTPNKFFTTRLIDLKYPDGVFGVAGVSKVFIPENGVILPGIGMRRVLAQGSHHNYEIPVLAVLTPVDRDDEKESEVELFFVSSYRPCEAPVWFPDEASHLGTLDSGLVHVFVKKYGTFFKG
ncbi:MAG: hypothetical protein ACXABY_01380 [Candidatus Thorarchaeota archaeon]|jgi:hypothetical protein